MKLIWLIVALVLGASLAHYGDAVAQVRKGKRKSKWKTWATTMALAPVLVAKKLFDVVKEIVQALNGIRIALGLMVGATWVFLPVLKFDPFVWLNLTGFVYALASWLGAKSPFILALFVVITFLSFGFAKVVAFSTLSNAVDGDGEN